MKILHTADWHLRRKDIEEGRKCLAFLVETARTEKADLVTIAGDIFDSQEVKVDSPEALLAIQTISALADIAPVAVILGTPSHDGHAPEILRFARGIERITVASAPVQLILTKHGLEEWAPVDEHKAVVTLIPQPTKQFFQTAAGIEAGGREIGQAMSGLFAGFGAQAAQYPGVPHILVTHLNVNGCRLAGGQIRTGMDIEVSVDQMNMGGFDLGCLGHIHKAQTLGEKYFYSGPIYSTKIDEEGPMGFWIHDYTGTLMDEWESRFIETPCKRTVRIQDDLTTKDAPSNLWGTEVSGAHIRYEVSIFQDEIAEIDKATLTKELTDRGALSVDIRINAVPRVNVRAESVLAATTLREEIQEMAKLRGEEIDPDVLLKAELLENVPGEELMERIVGGAACFQ